MVQQIPKRITIRVPSALHQALTQAAKDHGMSLNDLAVDALERHLQHLDEVEAHFPLQELGNLLAPEARKMGLTEDDLALLVKKVRRRRWETHYRPHIEKTRRPTASHS